MSELKREDFERSAKNKGYSIEKISHDKYEDCFLQAAWEIFQDVENPTLHGRTGGNSGVAN